MPNQTPPAGDNPPVRLEAVISGRVKGVGFRYFVMRQARRRGLAGWVRNLPNGTVKVCAEGNRRELERLLADLRYGPSGARVDSIEVEWKAPNSGFSGFRLRWW
jgi:acylphosphatase